MIEPLDIDHHPPVGLPQRLHLPDKGSVLFADGHEVRAIPDVQPLGTSLDRLVEQFPGALAFRAGLSVALVPIAPVPDGTPVDVVHIHAAPRTNRLEKKKKEKNDKSGVKIDR